MKINWKPVVLLSLCATYLLLREGVGLASGNSGTGPLCNPLVASTMDPPGIAGDGQLSSSYQGPVMKYGDSPRADAEAEVLAFRLRNQLLATTADYSRVRRDLGNIRQQFPAVQDIRFFGEFADGQLIVTLTSPVDQLTNSALYDETNRFMAMCREERFASFEGYDVARLWFPARMNMEVLAERYHPDLMPNLHGLSSPNDLGSLADVIRVAIDAESREGSAEDTVWSYEFERGWLDCIDGCECKDIHMFETDASGAVEFLGRVLQFLPGWEQVCLDTWGSPV